MTGARPGPQTTCVTDPCTSTCDTDPTLRGSTWVHATASSARGRTAWTSKKRRAFNSDGAVITGTSATDVVSVGGHFQFPIPGNG